ncbi:histidine phosphatase family protein [soil metagenome]
MHFSRVRFYAKFLVSVLSCSVSCSATFAQSDNMVFVVDVIRHGDRAPIEEIPKASYTGNLALGQLSPVGMQQEFQLGSKFRELYIKTNHLLPEHYLQETMLVRSSDIDRTLMSAQSVLLGLYPQGTGPLAEGKPALPFLYQPIPIHTKPRSEDSLLVVDFNPNLHATLDTYVHATATWKEKNSSLQPRLDHWNEVTGLHMQSLSAVAGLGDTLSIYKLHHIPLPKGLTDADVNEIIDCGQWVFAETFRPNQVGNLTSHELLNAIAQYLEKGTDDKNKLKYVLFSAHDTTISGLMSILGAPVDRRPPYASDLNFTLSKKAAEYKVRIQLNGVPVAASGFVNGEGSLNNLKALLETKINGLKMKVD